jgi:UDP-N-acetyl-D-mannosaminuronic acid dehydrogenase
VGGHCISVDPWFFVESAPDLARLIHAARTVNDGQPHYAVELVRKALGSLQGKHIAALGLAYKPDVDDLRESPANEVVHLLQHEGATVSAWEPFKPDANLPGIQMAASFEESLREAEAIVLLVKHTEFAKLDPQEVAKLTPARVVVDTVNAWTDDAWKNAGFQVWRLGNGK